MQRDKFEQTQHLIVPKALNFSQLQINLDLTPYDEDNGEVYEQSEISPSKLKEAYHQSRAHIHQLISEKTQEIE